MTEYERAVLEAVAAGPEYVGWYKIEQRLSQVTIQVREYLPDALARLVAGGFIEAHPTHADSFRVTAKGRGGGPR